MSRLSLYFLNLTILLLAVLFFIWVDSSAGNKRSLPLPAKIYRVSAQSDVYDIYKSAGLRGARVIHLNRFFNIEDYFPKEEATSVPFPIKVYDIRPAYEKGLSSHNWLFIATRTGLVRTITTILPEPVFIARLKDFASDFAYTVSPSFSNNNPPPPPFDKGGQGGLSEQKIKGYDYDIPMTVETLRSLPLINEPVVVDVDAGFFSADVDPVMVAAILREKCPDIRIIVLVDSVDEPEVTEEMRKRLGRFETALENRT